MAKDTPYSELSPEAVLDSMESAGFRCDGRLLALNSYENRVYQIGIEEGEPVIAKFYRPGRWSDAAILEEHGFALELAAQEIPVVAPLLRDGVSLHTRSGYRYAVFPAAAAVGRNSERSRTANGSDGSSGASMPSAAPPDSRTGRA